MRKVKSEKHINTIAKNLSNLKVLDRGNVIYHLKVKKLIRRILHSPIIKMEVDKK